MLRGLRAGGALAALTLLAACGSSASGDDPTWKPAPSFQGENVVPGNPGGAQPGAPSQAPAPTTGPSSASPAKPVGDPNVVATKLQSPTGLVILPDGSALVGERTTGRIVRVQPVPGDPVKTVRTLTGLSTTGDGGLLDLALSPSYSEDSLIFAYLTTPTDNRVVTFTLNGPMTPVLTGIPRGSTDNTGRIAFDSEGNLLVGTGDAGHPALAANPSSLAGKILRITDIGGAAADNPIAGSRIYASGQKVVDGLCVTPEGGPVFETETRPTSDPVNAVLPGANYGWPTTGTNYRKPLLDLPQTSGSPGGCAVMDNRLFITSRDGEALLATTFRTGAALGTFTPSLRGKYGRLRTVVAAPDGALWLTTSNRDGAGTPVSTDDRVLRIVPDDDASSNA